MRHCIAALWVVAAACGDSKPAPPAPPPTPSPTAPIPQPPAPKPLTVREVFGIPFGTTLTGIRVDSVDGPCHGGLEYRNTSVTSKHRTIDVWGYGMGPPPGVTCDLFTSKTIPVLFRAVEQLAGLGTGPIAITGTLVWWAAYFEHDARPRSRDVPRRGSGHG